VARTLTSPAVRIGRAVPAVGLAAGSLATSELLLEAGVDAVAVPVAPAAPDDTDLQPRRGTADAAAQKFKNKIALFLFRKDVSVMAVVYATLIVKGKKTLEQVPASLKVQVTELLKDLEVEV
jgi:hypothetical protein